MAHRSFSAEEVLESVTNDTNDYIFDGSDDELGFEDTSDDDRFTEVSVESEIEEVIADLQERNGEMEHSGTMELTENAAIQDTCRQKEHMEEEMEHDGGSTELSWSDLLEPVSYENFKDEKGPTTALPATPLEVFRLFFNSTITELLVTETNRYASLCLGEERYESWDPVTEKDIFAYFGVMIVIGLIKLPSIADYWRTILYFTAAL
ncbi:PREDICTED: uncharacterized protein LOC105314748 [Amphimedon queenslandica]|uniref:PiggyBac transposable element-derived protein domain-containing protein n=1 Tax=Amphimedon queenslandica TaxID=400682 RepID=A0A1X7TJS9_AMPQE|nr:PREDICTED: uncharacterized protein LOC105314748 [Amphimedon queenslandica]|eukprot:XP_011407403.1 PREDICTED: uncharacterized protein LOC105314748 [Amphimedon queenslandica]